MAPPSVMFGHGEGIKSKMMECTSAILHRKELRVDFPSRALRLGESLGDGPRSGTESAEDPSGSDFSKNRDTRRLFDGIAPHYDLLSQALSFFQAGSWRRFLISRMGVGPEHTVLDVCTGTAGVAVQIAQKSGARVVGVDLTDGMLRRGQRNICRAGLNGKVSLLMGRAENLGFLDESFDAVCHTWLLRYVDDPRATLAELVRVLKPGGSLLSLEFGVPENVVVRKLWSAYTRIALPLATRWVSPGWRFVGDFLGPSIAEFYRSYSEQDIGQMWSDLGISNVQVKSLSLGGGVVMWGTKGQGNDGPR